MSEVNRLGSLLGMGNPSTVVLPVPDGALDSKEELLQTCYLYGFDFAAADVEVVAPGGVYLLGIPGGQGRRIPEKPRRIFLKGYILLPLPQIRAKLTLENEDEMILVLIAMALDPAAEKIVRRGRDEWEMLPSSS